MKVSKPQPAGTTILSWCSDKVHAFLWTASDTAQGHPPTDDWPCRCGKTTWAKAKAREASG